jgi:predicted lysophospholipase L1 biosynthesis ABC-type transport system permease subunit
MVLGAGRSRVISMILLDIGRVLALGITAGAAVALVTAQAVRRLLYGLDPTDPAVLAAAVALLAVVGLAAAALPARRAAALNPASTLRD